jgi:PAS domain S-box-containing protein
MMGTMGAEAMEQGRRAWEDAVKRGSNQFDFKYHDDDGNWFQTHITIMALEDKESVMVTTFDITKLKRAQKELEESEKRYRTIFDTAGTGMICFDEDGVITLVNEEWAKLSGYSIEETVGKKIWMPFFSEDSLEKMRKYHEMRTENPASVPTAYEAQCVDRQGNVHDGIINIQVVPGTQQRVASFQDMTALKKVQKEMYRADKMASLGQIIAGVAHEINNPNNFIYFNLPILKKYIEAIRPMLEHHLEDDPDLRILNMPYDVFLEDIFKLLENMEHGSKRITGIVSELKTYVHSDEDMETRTEPVGPVIERVMALVGKQVRKMVKRFGVEVEDGLPLLRMNPGKIEQLLINLVINAGQAADKDDSWVRLTARPGAAKSLTGVDIVVADNGTGIPDGIRDQIFEPFFTSKGREAGTGLGLSICHRIVEEHGGTIDVESAPGEGTVFTIFLPAYVD